MAHSRRLDLPLRWLLLLLGLGAAVAPGSANAERPDKIDGFVRSQLEGRLEKTARARATTPGPVRVTLRFTRELGEGEIAAYEGRGIAFTRLPSGKLANVRRSYPARVPPGILRALTDDPLLEYVSPGQPPQAKSPSLGAAVRETGAGERHFTPTGFAPNRLNRGKGVVIASMDTGIDLFHPSFFELDEAVAPYDYIPLEQGSGCGNANGFVDLDRDGQGEAGECLGVIIPPGRPPIVGSISALDFLRAVTLADFLYHDANNNGVRDFGPQAGFEESDVTYGERWFVPVRGENTQLPPVGVAGFELLFPYPGDQLRPLGESKIRSVLDFERADGSQDPSDCGDAAQREYRRGVDLIATPRESDGHGTMTAGVLVAGSADLPHHPLGFAPDAELVVVNRYCGDPIANLAWAKEQGAEVVLWELGAWTSNFLDGSSDLEQAITDDMEAGDALHVIPNGNLGNADDPDTQVDESAFRHAQATIPISLTWSDESTVQLDAAGAPLPVDESITFSVLVRDERPSIEIRKTGVTGYVSIPADGFTIVDEEVVSATSSASVRGTQRIDLRISKSVGGQMDGGGQQWEIRFAAALGRTVHAFAAPPHNEPDWVGGGRWLTQGTAASTITWPATADEGVNVGSWDLVDPPDGAGNLSPFSGRGPRIDGNRLHDVTAPSDDDLSQTPAIGTAGDVIGFDKYSGTSGAGPQVAGVAALLIESVPRFTGPGRRPWTLLVQDALREGARSDAFTDDPSPTPNAEWGYGKLDAADADAWLQDEVCYPPIPTPAGGSPSDEVGLDTNSVTLSWSALPRAQVYDVYLDTQDPPRELVYPNLVVTSFPAPPLQNNTTYYWRVYAKNNCSVYGTTLPGGYVATGPVWRFSTGLPANPEIDVLADSVPLPNGGTYRFPTLPPGQQASPTFEIRNTGSDPLVLQPVPDLVNMEGESFSVGEVLPVPIPPGVSRPLFVTFAPIGPGPYLGQLRIASNDQNESPYLVTLRGDSATEIDLAWQGRPLPASSDVATSKVFLTASDVGQSETTQIEIRNRGLADLVLTGTPAVEITGANADEFAVTAAPATQLAPNGSTSFSVRFTPVAFGTRSAQVTVRSNDADEGLYRFRLEGYGGTCEPSLDSDCDTVDDADDNCPRVPNPDQRDTDAAGLGDLCVAPVVGSVAFTGGDLEPSLAVGTGLLFATGDADAISIYDVSVASAPAFVAAATPVGAEPFFDLAAIGSTVFGMQTIQGVGAYQSPGLVQRDLFDTTDAREMAISGGVGFLADTFTGVRALNLSNPDAIAQLDSLSVGGWVESIAVRGNLVFAGTLGAGLKILNAANPADLGLVTTVPVALGSFPGIYSIAPDATLVLFSVVSGALSKTVVLDVTNPAQPLERGSLPTSYDAMVWNGDRVLGARRTADLDVLDLSDPDAPRALATLPIRAADLVRNGRYLYALTADAIEILDLDPDNDGDGIADSEEAALGTSALLADTDADGLSDRAERDQHGTDPTDPDGDEDGLLDGVELTLGTDPANPDSDGDGIEDGDDPRPLSGDRDADGVDDEADNCPETPNGFQTDADADGAGNACDGDFDADLQVGDPDFAAFLACFDREVAAGVGPGHDPDCAESDMNSDGFVGGPDFDLLLRVFDTQIREPVLFGDELFPTFGEEKCTTCHSFTDPANTKRQQHVAQGRFAASADVTNRAVCAPCHNAPVWTNDWVAPPATQDFSGLDALATCEMVLNRLPTLEELEHHFTNDARIFWALDRIVVDRAVWIERSERWLADGARCE